MEGWGRPTKRQMARQDLVHSVVYDRTMKQVNMHDAKTHLSRYVAELEPGEALILCNRHEPVAEIRLIARKKAKRRIGVAKGQVHIPPSFFDPLPEELARAFRGE
jgi:antitoxin (DNA-binding transcriptional repressor) of toxin-antitoxin stability system